MARKQPPIYNPSPERIAMMKAEIRREWEKAARPCCGKKQPYMPRVCRVSREAGG